MTSGNPVRQLKESEFTSLAIVLGPLSVIFLEEPGTIGVEFAVGSDSLSVEHKISRLLQPVCTQTSELFQQ